MNENRTKDNDLGPYPDKFCVWLSSMGTKKNAPQRSFSSIFSMDISFKKLNETVCKYFSRDTNMLPNQAKSTEYFHTLFRPTKPCNMARLCVSLNHLHSNFEKMLNPKSLWVQYWYYLWVRETVPTTVQQSWPEDH